MQRPDLLKNNLNNLSIFSPQKHSNKFLQKTKISKKVYKKQELLKYFVENKNI